ncbi:MAG: hypothetical protein KF833_22615 [Verrucomicrobiae bacterium]|nr:hypothetical protein [Verrucomicrobiae bacterium]
MIPHATPSTRLASSLPRYGLAAGAALAGAALTASGTVIFVSGPSLTSNVDHPEIEWDIDGGGTVDFTFRFTSLGNDVEPVAYGEVHADRAHPDNAWVKSAASDAYSVEALSAGFSVGPDLASDRFQNSSDAIFLFYGEPWAGGGTGLSLGEQYVGFRFDLSGQTHYGWARISMTGGGPDTASVTLHDWAYSSLPNAALQVAAVPEPAATATALGLLSLGAAGVAAYRRRRGTPATP